MKLPVEDLENVCTRTASLWEEVRDKRLFVTGGTGFFGCWLMESFCHINRELKLNAQATVLTRNPERFAQKAPHIANDPAVELLRGDVRDFEFPSGEFEFIMHAATNTSGEQGTGLEFLDTIVAGTRRVLEFARAHGTKKLLLTSSGAVYGVQPPAVANVDETFTGAPEVDTTPLAIYAEGKRVSELLCHLYAQQFGVECKIARCFAFVGPHLPLDAHFAIGNFIRDQLEGGPIVVGGDGTPMRSYMYASDLAVWLWTILFRGRSCRPYNVGSDQAISIAELAQTVSDALSPRVEFGIKGTPVTGAMLTRYVPSTARAQEELGLRCDISLEEAIQRTRAWYVDHPSERRSPGTPMERMTEVVKG
jgi:dTDP-glucose 4,6-dehydratase